MFITKQVILKKYLINAVLWKNDYFDKKNKDILYNIFSLFNEAIEKENIMFTFYNLKNNEYYHAHAIYSQHNHVSNINVELDI